MRYEPVEFPRSVAVNELLHLGYLKDAAQNGHDFADAVAAYQLTMGLVEDGVLGPITSNSLRWGLDGAGNSRICGVPDLNYPPGVEEANIPNGTQTWPNPADEIVLGINFTTISGLTATEVRDSFEAAFSNINQSIGVRLKFGNWEESHVRITKQRLSGSTLALALLSTGSRRIGGHYQRYDSDREWWQAMFVAVIIHETLHTLGFSHSSNRNSILYPTFNRDILEMTPADISRMLPSYPRLGPPDPPPPPEPDDPVPSGAVFLTGSINGKLARLRGTLEVSE